MTPLIKIGDIYFTREDQNITGSAKDRSIALHVKHLKDNYFSSERFRIKYKRES